MCGRYTLATFEDQLAEEFELLKAEVIDQRYNIAPTQAAPVVRALAADDAFAGDGDRVGGNRRQLDLLRWGLVPSWAKDISIGNRMINARCEGIESKPSFRTPIRRKRCLVPCTGYYEWKKVEGGTPSKPKKQPYYIRRRDERVFALAGLWDRWGDPNGDVVETYSILTTSPNDLMKPLHHRMPVIVGADDYDLWLDPKVQDIEPLRRLFEPYPDDEFVAFPVSKQVNSPSNDSPECIAPQS
ncbi:MAG: SOS response-associated peptidase [Phycisphaerae bacterium]|nr:SOS response-associated peptidase [Phycisphaerales bacterium]